MVKKMNFKEKIKSVLTLRRLNALIVILIFVFLIQHALLSVLYLYNFIDYSPDFKIAGRRLFWLVLMHIIVSLYLFYKDHRKRKKISLYKDIITETHQQIITGIFIVLFASLHVVSYSLYSLETSFGFSISLVHFIIDNLLFISLLLHLRVSIPRLLVSLGFLVEKDSYRKVKKIVNILVVLIFLILLLAEIMFYLF